MVWVEAIDGWLVLARETAVEVMRDAATFTVDDPRFTTGRVVGPSMLSLDGADHARHRAPFVAPYRRGQLGELESWIGHEARRLIDSVRPAGQAELRTSFAGPLATATIHRSLDLVDTDPDDLLDWYQAIVGAVSDLSEGLDARSEAADAMASLRAAVARTIAARPDSMLTGARATLSADEVAQNAAIVLFGAIETAEGMIANALWHLLGTPGLVERVRETPTLVAAVVEESLRLEPAAAAVDRYATVDFTIEGAEIAAGDLVRVSLAAANRDPTVFRRPDEFLVDRPDARKHLAFASGPHLCIGLLLARIETIAAVQAVLGGLPYARLDDDRSDPPTGLIFRKPRRVTATWARDGHTTG